MFAGPVPVDFGTLGYTFYGYPFVMTEFNYVAPSQFRFAGGLLMGAAAALQDANGLWQHSYSFNTDQNKLGWFNYISDPLMPAWSRAILTLFVRGDMRPLTQTYVTRLDPAAMCSDDETAKSAVSVTSQPHVWASWYRKTGLLVADEDSVPAGVTLSGDGARRFQVPCTKEGKKLRFTADIGADPNEATYLYEIVRPRGALFFCR